MNVAQLGGPIVGGLLLEAGFGLAGIDHAGCVFKIGSFPPQVASCVLLSSLAPCKCSSPSLHFAS